MNTSRSEKLFAFLCLSSIKGLGPSRIKQLLQLEPSAPKALLQVAEVFPFLKTSEQFKKKVWENKATKLLNKINQQKVPYLLLTDKDYPYLLKQIPSPPPILFWSGQKDVLSKPCIAIVGTRNATRYGQQMTQEIASALSKAGLCIVSGLAVGIDSIAHAAALEHGSTIAVLGCGINVNYPSSNAGLKQKIKQKGLLLSEYIPDTAPEAHNFPLRNRIISGLSLGVIVIEAKEKSGALITAQYALEQGREIFALPGTCKMPNSAGCNRLIQQGAYLIQSVQDIFDILQFQFKINPLPAPQRSNHITIDTNSQIGSLDIENTSLGPMATQSLQGLNNAEKKIVSLLQKEDKIHIDKLTNTLDFSSGELNSILLQLEVKGIIKRLPGMYFSVKQEF
ncbi:MAG: DNA-processing protein DprA [Desulfonauticus sp.]|nr:DNA-processing protein DprA [Desulfonauticus sp.]